MNELTLTINIEHNHPNPQWIKNYTVDKLANSLNVHLAIKQLQAMEIITPSSKEAQTTYYKLNTKNPTVKTLIQTYKKLNKNTQTKKKPPKNTHPKRNNSKKHIS